MAGGDREDTGLSEQAAEIQSEEAIGSNYRTVSIDRVTNGYIIRVGCMTFVAETWDQVYDELKKYWKDPIKTERYYKDVVSKKEF